MDTTRVTLDYNLRAAATAREHTWYADVPEADGGDNTAPTPEEMLLGALGACISITVMMYANRKGWPLDNIAVHLEMERFKGSEYAGYEGDSQYVHEIRESVRLYGALDHEQRARLLEIAGKCPVRRVLSTPTFFVPFESGEDE